MQRFRISKDKFIQKWNGRIGGEKNLRITEKLLQQQKCVCASS